MPNEEQNSSASEDISRINHVALKLPTFWMNDVSLWFNQAEAQFSIANATSSTLKFNHTLSVLPQEVASQVRDVIVSSSTSSDPYSDLKSALISRNTISEKQKLHQLFSKEELGDRKPSAMLRDMQRILGPKADSFDKAMFKELFLQNLPTSVQKVLATLPHSITLDILATTADQVMEVHSLNPQTIQHVSNSEKSQIDNLTSKIGELCQLFSKDRSRFRSSSPSDRSRRPRSKSRSKSRNRSKFCFYHDRFGKAARKCNSPCSFSNSGNHQGEF